MRPSNLFRFILFSLMGAFALYLFGRLVGKPIEKPYQSKQSIDEYKLPEPDSLAAPMLQVEGSEKAVELSELKVTTRIQGSIAITRYTMTFHNHEFRDLEAELNFPLAEGQSIRYFAMQINGEWRSAVAVEKQKARIAFESTIRRQVDPGLLEMTIVNNFKARVYPVPAKGKKRIILEYMEDLKAAGQTGYYYLPLLFKNKLEHFSWNVSIADLNQLVFPFSKDIPFIKSGKLWKASLEKKQFCPNGIKKIGIKNNGNASVLSATSDGKTQYFQAQFFVNDHQKHKIKPRLLTIFWDVSGSRAQLDLNREKALLKNYLTYLKNVTVELIPFANTQETKQYFQIQNADSKALFDYLETVPYDGGTNLDLSFNQAKGAEILVFSDGLSNMSWEVAKASKKRVYAISNASSADYNFLHYLSSLSGGNFLNLNQLSNRQALSFLKADKLKFIGFEEKNKSLEYYPLNAFVQNGNVSISGKAPKQMKSLTALFGYGNKVMERRKIYFNCVGIDKRNKTIETLFAMNKIQFLSGNYRKNKKEITDLGLKYRLVTQNTSLLVLDNVEDYVEHEIVPPASLQKEYFRLLREKKKNEAQQKEEQENGLKEDLKEQKAWYKNPTNQSKKEREYLGFRNAVSEPENTQRTQVQADEQAPPPPPPAEMSQEHTQSNEESFSPPVVNGQNTYEWTSVNISANATSVGSTSTFGTAGTYTLSVMDANGASVSGGNTQTPNAHVFVKPWDSKEPYMAPLRKAKQEKLYETYLSLRPSYSNQPSFYIDAYELMKQRKLWKPAVRVISNLAELELENQSLLRILAQAMLRAKRFEQALFLYRKLVEMRAEEPQSYRDLGLALEENGLHQEAIKQLYKAATMTSDGRFRGIQLIAMNEINHILNRHKLKSDIVKSAYLYPFKVDIRIVLNWDADNTDVDLWVIDPTGEKCYYAHKLTAIGGRISNDFTGGYGPEEFLLRHAIPGEYKVMAHYYGDHSTTAIEGKLQLSVQLFKYYGSKFEKRYEFSRRLNNPNSVVEMGTFYFEK